MEIHALVWIKTTSKPLKLRQKMGAISLIIGMKRYFSVYPANTRNSPNVVLMLAHRLRRWPNIKTALGESLVFAGHWIRWININQNSSVT